MSLKGYDAIECEACEFIHVVPLPTFEELQEYYETSFYEVSKPNYLVDASRDQEWLNVGYDTKLDMLAEALQRDPDQSARRPRILDIGSGPGHFLLRAQERGWDVVGLEAAPMAVKFSRALGLDVRLGYFRGKDEWNLGSFDAVHMQHVLEHVPDPDAVLSGLSGLLRPGAAICVEVPNDFSAIQEILHTTLGFPAWWVAPPEHLNYFSQQTLANVLVRHSFTNLAWSTQFPIDLILLAGINYVSDSSLGQASHAARVQLEVSLSRSGRRDILKDLYAAMVNIGIGRELIAVGVLGSKRASHDRLSQTGRQ